MSQRVVEAVNSHPSRRTLYISLALLLAAFAIRVWTLSTSSVWWDEAFTWQTTSHGWDNLWHLLQTGDRNPPLYFLSLMVWGSVAGWSEFSLRFLSVIYGLLGVACLARLAQRLFGSTASLWTLALAALSPALTLYSQEGRAYALFFACAMATVYFGFLILEFGLNHRAWRAFLIAEILLLLTHYFAVPIVLAINVLIVVRLWRQHAAWRMCLKWIAGQLLAALPLLIWTLLIFRTPGSLTTAAEQRPELIEWLRQAAVLWFTGIRDLDQSHTALAIAGGVIVCISVGLVWRLDRRRALGIVAFTAMSVIGAFGLTSVITAYHPRYVLPYGAAIWVLLGAALASMTTVIGNRARAARLIVSTALGLIAAFVVLAGWQVANDPVYAKDDARGVAAYLKANASADDVILVEANDYTLDYYDHGPALTKMITATTEVDALAQLNAAIGDHRQVWHVHWRTSTQDPRNYWPFLFNQSGWLTDWRSFQGYEVYRYELQTRVYNPPLNENRWDFGSFVSPRQSALSTTGNGVMTMVIDWQPTTGDPIWQRSSLALVDRSGQAIYKVDADLHDGLNYYVLPIPPGTPPISHTVTLKLYNAHAASAELPIGVIVPPRRAAERDPYRTLAGYVWWTPNDNGALPGLVLEAVSQSAPRNGVPALGQVDVILRWKKTADGAKVSPHVRLIQNGRVWVDLTSPLFERDYPVERWSVGETVIDRLQFTYPPLRGETQLQVGQGDPWIDLALLNLDETTLKFDVPTLQTRQAAQFGDWAELLGYDLKSKSIAVDRPLNVTVYWRAANTEPITTEYTVFTQLLAADGHLVAQSDAPPTPPTTAWVSGQIVLDSHALKVVDPTYRGPATLITGWYNSASVVRVPVASGGNFVTLATPIQVEER